MLSHVEFNIFVFQNADYTACLSDKFYCGDDEPRCINVNLTCDSYRDCNNGADEINCGK